ncbi:glycosyltransferase family 2 protein [Flavimarina sp. Hel_I_48]|uniref:glycosyltransferase family 2 protein n=1 Tax=Flavimarina sp. Hel_I_48 TaxID=1392488 RepID=UPI0004DF8035|nr:glycosyltransferase family A protein [Flavimarina sp. Hel_I_48]
MIVLVHHKGKKMVKAYRNGAQIAYINHVPALALYELAENYPDELLIWCEERFENGIDELKWQKILRNRAKMASYSCSGRVFLPEAIGFIDTSVFTKIRREVPYPTWIMSSDRGGIHAETLLAFKESKIPVDSFDYFLSTVAKQGMPHGLLTYSDPNIASDSPNLEVKYSTDDAVLYDFVRNNYKKRWLLLLFVQQLIYQKKALFFSFLSAIFKGKTTDFKPLFSFNNNNNNNNNFNVDNSYEIDVLIPTIGRKKYLYDVLGDLRKQTFQPKKVIIVEQNPDPYSSSELHYLTSEEWPFEIDHVFIHQAGACNARNIALRKVTADWVFFADDDIRIPGDFIAKSCSFIEAGESKAFTVSCLREEEREIIENVVQWSSFGSGCSFVKSSCIENIRFDLAFEGGFGEDADFGMQLRNNGVDILYNPFLKLRHLKAPVGGFRYQKKQPWDDEKVQPKPAPTVMVYQLKHATPLQRLGFKTVLFLKFYGRQSNRNPFTYFRSMQKRWEISKKWAKILIEQNP